MGFVVGLKRDPTWSISTLRLLKKSECQRMIWQFLISSSYFSVYCIFSQTADRNGQSTARYFLPSAPECCLTAQACAASLSFAHLSPSHPCVLCKLSVLFMKPVQVKNVSQDFSLCS